MRKNNMIKLAGTAFALSLTLTACSGGGTFATVNGQKISQERYDQQLEMYKKMISAQYQLPLTIEKSLIQEQVMLQDLTANKITPSDKDYKVEYDKAVQSYGGAEKYSQTLKTLGVDDASMRESLKFETISRMHKAWYNKTHAPKEETLKQYFEKNKDQLITVKASHILVKTEEDAKQVKEALGKGQKFEDLAKKLSQDPGSKDNGGALQEAAPSSYLPEFAQAVTTMKVGAISDPVKTQVGYHIIRLDERKDTYEALKDKITETILSQQYEAYVKDKVKKADVEKDGKKVEQSSQESGQNGESSQASQDSASSQETESSGSTGESSSKNN